MTKTYAHYNNDGDGDTDFATKEDAITAANELVEIQGDNASCYTIYELEDDIITAAWLDGDMFDGSKIGQPLYNV